MNIRTELQIMHSYLMRKNFPYHSVSVIHRNQDLGFHVIFMDSVREMVTVEIQQYIKNMGFTFSYVKELKSNLIKDGKDN